ncbi:uncharacterized protein LOC144065713 [Stigmatopora argus]
MWRRKPSILPRRSNFPCLSHFFPPESDATLLVFPQLEVFYQSLSSFRNLTVVSFSNGSIINNMDLSFTATNVPDNNAIARVLMDAASSITAFDVDRSSIVVGGAQVSSGTGTTTAATTGATTAATTGGTSVKSSLVTACGLLLLPWLLAN